MKITMQPTTKLVDINNIPARIWEGETENGVPCHVFVTRIAVSKEQPAHVHAEFGAALQERMPPSADVEAYPLRMII